MRGGAFRFAFLIEPPFCYRASDGAVTGCDVELARRVLRDIGVASFALVETEFAELLPGLADERWDMTTGLFVTDERQRIVDFSIPIWALSDGLIIRSDSPRRIDGYASIAGAAASRLAIVRDQIQHQTALRLGVCAEQIEAFSAYADAAAAVAAGAVDAFASVAMAHHGYLNMHPGAPLSVVDVPSGEQAPKQGAFAFSKSQTPLRDRVNEALANFLGSADHRGLMARFGFSAHA